MARHRSRLLLLIPIAVIGSALLCLWLAQSFVEREQRQASRNALEITGRLALSHFQHTLSSLRSIGSHGLKPPRAQLRYQPSDSLQTQAVWNDGTLKEIAEQLQTDWSIGMNREGGRRIVTGLVLLDVPGKRVVASDVPSIAAGEPLSEPAALRLLDLLRLGQDGLQAISVGTKHDWSAAWLGAIHQPGHPASRAILMRVDIGFLLNLSIRQAVPAARTDIPKNGVSAGFVALDGSMTSTKAAVHADPVPVDPTESGIVGSLDQALYRTSLPLAGSSPTLQVEFSQPRRSAVSIIGPLAYRVLAGSGLLALILVAVCWRWEGPTGELTVALSKTLDAVSQGDMQTRGGLGKRHDPQGYSRVLDKLLDRHVALAASVESEQESLERSAAELQRAVMVMGNDHDLTGRLKSSSDVTGATADAVNCLRDESVSVLTGISASSQSVAAGAEKLHEHASRFDELIGQQRADLQSVDGNFDQLLTRLSVASKAGDSIGVLIAGAGAAESGHI